MLPDQPLERTGEGIYGGCKHRIASDVGPYQVKSNGTERPWWVALKRGGGGVGGGGGGGARLGGAPGLATGADTFDELS